MRRAAAAHDVRSAGSEEVTASPAVSAARASRRRERAEVATVARGSGPDRISAEEAGVVEAARARAAAAALAAKVVAEAPSAAVIEWRGDARGRGRNS